MKSQIIVGSSNQINKKGFCFSIGSLEQTVFENCEFGVPQLVEHDQHRTVGQTIPFGLYIQPNLVRQLSKSLLATTKNDFPYLRTMQLKFRNNKFNSDEFTNKTRILKEKFNLLDINEIAIKNYKGIIGYANGLLYKLYPYLRELRDKDGLINLEELLKNFNYIGNGALKNQKDGFIIFCHSFFRRNLSRENYFHTPFLNSFFSLKNQDNITLKIALDEDCVTSYDLYDEYLELDYWFGPVYNDNIAQLPYQVTRYESNDNQKFFSQVSGMDFWWKAEKDPNLKTLEAEEIREKPTLGVGETSYGCRYVHSIYDISLDKFEHFDGAIRMYDEEKIMNRWENNINKSGKDTEYTKLFRIDGKLSLEDWKLLTTLYYHGNPLVYEYFEASPPQTSAASNVNSDLLNESPSISFEKSQPLRIFITYRPINSSIKTKSERIVYTYDKISLDNETISILEYDILEVKKILLRMGENLELPNDIRYTKFYDLYTNYPIIYHHGNNVNENLNQTIRAYKTIFTAQNTVMDKFVSFGLGWEMEGKLISISISGKICEILKWFEEIPVPPTERLEFRTWIDKAYDWLSLNYSETDFQDLIHMVEEDGTLYIKRDFTNSKHIKDIKTDEMGLKFGVDIDEIDVKLKADFESGRLTPAHVILLNQVKCSKTGEDYFSSTTSKYLDDTIMIIESCELLGFFWTDKPLK